MLYLPQPEFVSGGGSAVAASPNGFSQTNLEAVNEEFGWLLEAPKAGDIESFFVRMRSVTTGATLDGRIETVAGGEPTGTLVNAGANVAHVLNSSDDNLWLEILLDTPAGVTKNQQIAPLLVNPGAAQASAFIAVMSFSAHRYPLNLNYNGTWARNHLAPVMALKYTDDTYPHIPGVYPFSEYGSVGSFNSASTPDEIGLRFLLPDGYIIYGFWANLLGAAAGAIDINLYANGDTETRSLDTDDWAAVANYATVEANFDNPVTVAPETEFRLTIKPTTGDFGYVRQKVASPALMEAVDGYGESIQRTERTDGGSWTETDTERISIGIKALPYAMSGGLPAGVYV